MPSAPLVLALLVGGLGCATTPSTTAGSPSSDEGKATGAPAVEGNADGTGTAAATASPPQGKGVPKFQLGEYRKSKDSWTEAIPTLFRIQPKFHQCYATALEENAEATGYGSIHIVVDADGEVSKVQIKPSQNTPPALVECVEAVIKSTKWPAPKVEATIDTRYWARYVD
jgi:hypothetical protein